jgi:hypothetical protein
MNPDLSLVFSLRRVLESAGEGKGMAQSIVEELRASKPSADTARMILLGLPLQISLAPLVWGESKEVSMLASLIIGTPKSSAFLVGKNGEAVSLTLERWLKAKENSKLESRVMRFRSLVASGVLGAVTAMVASLGPLVSSLSFSDAQPPVDAGTLLLAAAGMTAVSSGMLGMFMSGRRFYPNVLVALGAFAIVGFLVHPLASVPIVSLWAVK